MEDKKDWMKNFAGDIYLKNLQEAYEWNVKTFPPSMEVSNMVSAMTIYSYKPNVLQRIFLRAKPYSKKFYTLEFDLSNCSICENDLIMFYNKHNISDKVGYIVLSQKDNHIKCTWLREIDKPVLPTEYNECVKICSTFRE